MISLVVVADPDSPAHGLRSLVLSEIQSCLDALRMALFVKDEGLQSISACVDPQLYIDRVRNVHILCSGLVKLLLEAEHAHV